MFPDGLANSSGLVGKCFMVHSGHQVFARFEERINQSNAPPGLALTEHFNRTMPDAAFVCGYTYRSRRSAPRRLRLTHDDRARAVGADLRRAMLDYNYWSGIGIVGEVMPQRANAVRLHPTERDQYGLPVPHVVFEYHENDRRLIAHAVERMKEIVHAAGGTDIWTAEARAFVPRLWRPATRRR